MHVVSHQHCNKTSQRYHFALLLLHTYRILLIKLEVQLNVCQHSGPQATITGVFAIGLDQTPLNTRHNLQSL